MHFSLGGNCLSVLTWCVTSVTMPVVVCCILHCGNQETSMVSVAMTTTLHPQASRSLTYFCCHEHQSTIC